MDPYPLIILLSDIEKSHSNTFRVTTPIETGLVLMSIRDNLLHPISTSVDKRYFLLHQIVIVCHYFFLTREILWPQTIEIVLNDRMDFWNVAIKIIFLSQITTGIFGNFTLLFYYLVLYNREHTLKPTDFILMHLLIANVLVILFSGVHQTIAVFGLKEFLNNFECEFLVYIQEFGRSVSICTTCLLSVFQVITISPRIICWKNHKFKPANNIGYSISLLWVLYMLIYFILFMYTIIKRNEKNVTRKRGFRYCSLKGTDDITDSLYLALVVCSEVFFSVLIAWSSGSMIVILYRHKQRVQYLHRIHGFCRTSHEYRATQNILILVSTFLTFYTLPSILRGFIAFLPNQNWWLTNINYLSSLCFPCFAPFVFMSHYSTVSRFSLAWLRKNLQKYVK